MLSELARQPQLMNLVFAKTSPTLLALESWCQQRQQTNGILVEALFLKIFMLAFQLLTVPQHVQGHWWVDIVGMQEAIMNHAQQYVQLMPE